MKRIPNCWQCDAPGRYYEKWDSYGCPGCGLWLERDCEDVGCEYCDSRPEDPPDDD